ncbi:MAG: hypothetical protein KAI47_12395 [Deltaproteobacteria bacterium]|nr:hypothetical protein [Deltaproteobacteria bacterium]
MTSWILRGGLLTTAIISWNSATMLWEGGSCASSILSTSLMLLGYLAGFALLLQAIIEHPRPRARWFVLATLLLVFASYAQNHRIAQLENGLLTTDVRLYMDQAARLLRHGQNPYSTDLLDSYRLNRAPFNFSTPLLDGDLTGRVAYPALSILIFLPFQWTGVPPDWVYPIFLLLAFVAIFLWSPKRVQSLVLLPLFVDPRYILYSLGGVSDIVWALLLVVMLRFWDRPRHRAIWFGLACAFKHQPWILAPFLLIRIWHETDSDARPDRGRALGRFIVWTIGTFVLVNFPFFLWNPAAWFTAVFEPVVAPMITFGQGLSALTMFGYIVIPKIFFALFMATALGIALFTYYRHFAQLRLLLWIAPGLMLWLSNRSLTSYWYFYLIPLLYDLARTPHALLSESAPASRTSSLSWRPTIVALLTGGLAIVGSLAFLAMLPPRIDLRIVSPLITEGNHVMRLDVAVRNTTDHVIEPRFTVQAAGLQPFFWHIDLGPKFLRKGQRAHYTISSDAPFSRFEVRHGARLTISQAGSQHIRQTIQIEPDRTYVYPDIIPNPGYRFWATHSHAPTFWSIVQDPKTAGTVRYKIPRGAKAPSSCLSFSLRSERRPASLFVDTYLDLPRKDIEVTVKPPLGANVLPDLKLLYGLRLIVDDNQVLVLFGDHEATGRLGPRLQYVILPAPIEKWSRIRISLPSILQRVKLNPLPRRHRMPRFGHLDFPVVPTNVQLFFARRVGYGDASCEFGPLRSLGLRPNADSLYAEALDHPATMALWRGEYNFAQHNMRKARAWIARAARLEPTSPRIQLQLGEAEFWLGRYNAAITAFARARGERNTKAFALKGIGWSHYNLQEYEEAILAWRSAVQEFKLRNHPNDRGHVADVHKGMAMAFLRQARCPSALLQLQKARMLMPKIAVPQELLRACHDQPATSLPR